MYVWTKYCIILHTILPNYWFKKKHLATFCKNNKTMQVHSYLNQRLYHSIHYIPSFRTTDSTKKNTIKRPFYKKTTSPYLQVPICCKPSIFRCLCHVALWFIHGCHENEASTTEPWNEGDQCIGICTMSVKDLDRLDRPWRLAGQIHHGFNGKFS